MPSFPVQDPRMFNNPNRTVSGSRHIDVHGVRYTSRAYREAMYGPT